MNRNRLILDRDAVRQVDRSAIEDYGIPGIVLMENASRGLADVACEMTGAGDAVLIVCGRGNNGGDGYAAARHLHNAGRRVSIVTLGAPRPDGDAGINRSIVERMTLPIADDADWSASLPDADLVVDAIFGTGLDRAVTGPAANAIARINEHAAPVLAVDVPSGLDADRGEPLGAAVRAAETVTFVAWKPGFVREGAAEWTGRIRVVDIGAPREVVERLAQ